MRRWSFSTFCRRVRGQLLVVLLCTIAFLVGGWLLRRLIYEAAVSEEKGGGRRLGSLCTLPPHLCVLLWKGGWRKAITFVRKAPSWPTSFLCEPRGCFEAVWGQQQGGGEEEESFPELLLFISCRNFLSGLISKERKKAFFSPLRKWKWTFLFSEKLSDSASPPPFRFSSASFNLLATEKSWQNLG